MSRTMGDRHNFTDTYTSHSWECVFHTTFRPLLPQQNPNKSSCMSPAEDPKGKTRQRRTPLWHPCRWSRWNFGKKNGGSKTPWWLRWRGYFSMAGFKGKGGFHRLNLRPMDFRLLIFRKHLEYLDINKWIMEPMISSFSETTTIYNLHRLTSIYRVFCGSATSSHSFPKSESMAVLTTTCGSVLPMHNAFQTCQVNRSLLVPHIKIGTC